VPAHFRYSALIAAALMVPVLAAAQTNVYRWVDKDGKVHFSDTPPPEPARSLTQKRIGGSGAGDETQLPYATQVAMRKSPVTLFTGTDCRDACGQARDLLYKRGIPFTERDAQASPEAAEELKKLVGALLVPTLAVGSNNLKGFEEGMWHSALDGAGYPRTALPSQLRSRPQPPPAESAAQPAPAEPPPAEPAETPPAAPEAPPPEPTAPPN
jgi:glutaredoxin